VSYPLFSIVTVTLNCADAFVRTAQSVLAQRFTRYEYIIKDGGSTDGTPERLQKMGVSQIHITPDLGVYSAMNQALAYCSGEYICFLNAGDSFPSPCTLDTVASWIRRHNCPAFLYGDVGSYARHPLLQGAAIACDLRREIQYRDCLSRFYLYRRMICHQAWYVRRSVYLRLGGFAEQYELLSDYKFLLGMVLQERVSYVHLPTVTAVYQGGGLSENDAALLAKERRAIHEQVFSHGERVLYGAAVRGMRVVSRGLVRRWVYPRLSTVVRKRLHGW
jgi:putative colanic acid biosynthesis glycosyltransferase